MSIYDVLKEKGIVLPPAPPKGGLYTQAMEFGDKLVYISGCGSNLEDDIVGLENVKKCVKILVFVSSDPDFYDQPKVANGASQLLVDIFGEAPSRSAVGMVSMPGNQPVEIEAIFELK